MALWTVSMICSASNEKEDFESPDADSIISGFMDQCI